MLMNKRNPTRPGLRCVSLMLIAMLLFGLAATAQTQPIKGVIVDEKGQPVAGATIKVKGSSEATTSADDGTYSLNVKTGASLIISYTGFEETEINTQRGNYSRIQLKQRN